MSTTAVTRTLTVGGTPTAATSMTCVVTRTDTGVTIANTATNPSTGIYTFTITDPVGVYGLTYNFTITTVYGGETYVNVTTAYGPTVGSQSGKLWTRTTLAAEIVKGLMRHASSTDTASAIDDCILEAYGDVWQCHDWEFRRRRGTMTLTAGTSTYALTTNYADYDKFEQRWLEDTNRLGEPFKFTNVPSEFEERARCFDSADTGAPELAIVEPLVVGTALTWVVRFTPTPDQAYSYPFYYMCTPPAIDTTTAPLWRLYMNNVWKLSATWRAEKMLHPNSDTWKGTYGAYKGVLDWAKSQMDELHTNNTPDLEPDPCGDWTGGGIYTNRIVRR